MTDISENYFTRLNSINVNDKVEEKNGLKYLSWAWAWQELKKNYPDSTYIVYENKDGWNYFTDGSTCWVKTGVTVNGLEHIELLPVMDYKNRSIPLANITSFDVNKAIQRSLTKACARHGIGLYIYAGEDIPDDNGLVDEIKKGVASEKRKQTMERKAEVKASIHTPEGAKLKFETAYAYVQKLSPQDTLDEIRMKPVNLTIGLLQEQNLTVELNKLIDLITSKKNELDGIQQQEKDSIPY